MIQAPHLGNLFEHTLAGQAFTAGLTSLAVPNGSHFRSLISNPLGSGITLAVTNIVFQSRTNKFFTIHVNPTTAPVTALPVGNRLVGSPIVAKGQQFADVSVTAMSGGSLATYEIAATNNQRNSEDLESPFMLMPGYAVGLDLFNDSGAATDVSFVSTWVEVIT